MVQENPVPMTEGSQEFKLGTLPDRRGDVDAKQLLAARLIAEAGCDGLLVLDPANFAWLTSGGTARAVLDPAAWPALYFSPEGRWIICSAVDSQRIFDEEVDGLGFQLKEWPWHWGRDQLLADLCQGRNVACDRPFGSCKLIADVLLRQRRPLTDYERACYRALGQVLSHALEATGRTFNPEDTEREVAGQLSHRLLHRGVQPVLISVAADGRARLYRQCGFTGVPIRSSCVLAAAARKYGLTAFASRSITFGQPDARLRQEHDAACRVAATYVAGSWPDAMPKQILATGRRVFQLAGVEHEWLLAPQGYITGHESVDLPLTPATEDLFQVNWAVTWNVHIGAALSADTYLVTDDGPTSLTPTENWPLKRIRVQGAEFVRPDLLTR